MYLAWNAFFIYDKIGFGILGGKVLTAQVIDFKPRKSGSMLNASLKSLPWAQTRVCETPHVDHFVDAFNDAAALLRSSNAYKMIEDPAEIRKSTIDFVAAKMAEAEGIDKKAQAWFANVAAAEIEKMFSGLYESGMHRNAGLAQYYLGLKLFNAVRHLAVKAVDMTAHIQKGDVAFMRAPPSP